MWSALDKKLPRLLFTEILHLQGCGMGTGHIPPIFERGYHNVADVCDLHSATAATTLDISKRNKDPFSVEVILQYRVIRDIYGRVCFVNFFNDFPSWPYPVCLSALNCAMTEHRMYIQRPMRHWLLQYGYRRMHR